MGKCIIVGIAGGTASGKSTLASRIKGEYKEKCVIIPHDCYYKSLTNLTKEEREQRNYDCPEAYETDLLISDLKKLKMGKSIIRPVYSYTERLREKDGVLVDPASIIIVEGILVLENTELLNLMDIKVFVDTDANIRLNRLLERDTKSRGLTQEYIISKYESTLKPMHEKYIEPTKKNADFIVSGNDSIEEGFYIVTKEISKIINKEQICL